MNLLNLFDIVDAVAAQKREEPAVIPAAVQVSKSDGQPATIVVPVEPTDNNVEVLEDDDSSLDIGDEVIITGNVQYRGKTGRVVDFGKNKHFVIVDLYNFGKHSFHASNVEHNDYADSDEEANDWQERELGEDTGSYYYEELAQKVFDQNPDLPTTGRANELFQAGIAIASEDLGNKRARWEFNYDEDFFSDFVSAYAQLQRGQQGVEEEYDPSYDPDYRPYSKPEQDPDAWKQQRDLEEPTSSNKTVVIKDTETGKEVARYPSTGGYYGDLRKSQELGFDFERGDYDVKWVDSVREGNNWLDAPVSESEDQDVGPALDAWKKQIKQEYPQLADWIKFFGKKDGQVSAEVPGRDRCYGVFDMNTGKGEVFGD